MLHRKHLQKPLNSLDATLTKNRGEGVCPLRTHHSFHIRGVHVHGDGPLDQFQRHDHPQTALFPLQHTFKSCERPACDPYAPSHRQERMRLRAQTPRKPPTHDFHFRVRQGSRQSPKANQPHHARNLQHAQALAQCEPYKNVPREEWQLQAHPAVFPAPHGTVQRKKVLDFSCPQLCPHTPFVVRARIRGIPPRLRHRVLLLQQNCRVLLSRRQIRNASRHHRRASHTSSSPVGLTQLRPVTYRAICDLTSLSSSTYSQTYGSPGPPAGVP